MQNKQERNQKLIETKNQAASGTVQVHIGLTEAKVVVEEDFHTGPQRTG